MRWSEEELDAMARRQRESWAANKGVILPPKPTPRKSKPHPLQFWKRVLK